ncbi:MAG: 1,5-anhydro-D-fructose reductase [candidate division BRC1 bacterium ADurb.BinA364]|nr:MAG: 1,5-anhydro-D-fructose reductase [candidate division BRC1 bacterium ADurb.BinA364]
MLMQKPLGQTLDEARLMVDIAEKAGIGLAVNQNARYCPACYAVKQLLAPERLGQPGILEIKNIVNSGYGLKLGPGGMIVEWGIHHADLLRWWADSAPVSVHASMKHKACVIAYEFENGVVASQIEVTAIAPKSETPIRAWTERGSIVANHRWNPWGLGSWSTEEVHFCLANQPAGGGFFTMALPGEAPWKIGDKPVYDYCAPIGGFIGVMGEFMQAISQGRAAPTNGRDNLLSLQMYMAALRSAETGAAVDPRGL